MDIIELDQNDTYTLQAEKVQGKWWLELITRATGQVQIVVCDTKKHAQSCFKGMTLEQVKTFVDKWGIEPKPMYKPNRM